MKKHWPPREEASIDLRDAIRNAAPYGSVVSIPLLSRKMLEDEALVDQLRSLCDDDGLLTEEDADEGNSETEAEEVARHLAHNVRALDIA